MNAGNEFEFQEINKVFENDIPIIARKNAFDYLQSCIDILLQFKGKKYISEKETRNELVAFVETGTYKLQIGDKEILFTEDSLGNGIGVYFVKDQEVKSIETFWGVGQHQLLYGIGNLSDQHLIDETILVLQEEAKYYDHFGYDKNGQEISVTYCSKIAWIDGCDRASIVTHKILKTPFDWEGYDKPYWWGKSDEVILNNKKTALSTSLEDIIRGGESNSVEFKPALLYNFKTDKAGISVKEIIAKSICAFLNSKGGFLFIGIDDNGKASGLEKDFSLSKGKNSKDFFQLEFDQMIKFFLGFATKVYINGQFIIYEGKEIYVVSVESSSRPIFLLSQHGKKLFIRGEASTRELSELEELINYCIERFKH